MLHYLTGPADRMLLMAHSGGTGLLARLGDLFARNKGGKAFLTLEPGEQWFAPVRGRGRRTRRWPACRRVGGCWCSRWPS